MSTHRHIDRLCCLVLALTLAVTLLFVNGEALGLQAASRTMGYEDRLFAAGRVHTVDIVMDDWDSFIDTCENEEYAACAVVIDGESRRNVGIRAKGNTSLSSVARYGNDRYSFKIEFDHYDSQTSYYGLDKLNLNNIIQDNTYMKDFLSYQMMAAAGAAAPLCSFVYITVNGEDWGLYLAVEGVEDGFLQRNYGRDAGNLYKPDSMRFGGGRGNGRGFAIEDLEDSGGEDLWSGPQPGGDAGSLPAPPQGGGAPAAGFAPPENGEPPAEMGGMGGGFGGMGSSDVKLQYIDDDPDSYANIFDSAKTDISDADRIRLIASLKTLSSGEDAARVVDVDAVIRYFVAHTFVCNGDSYTGSMVHNYYLYEKDGVLSMLPWDYNLAFGGFDAASGADSLVNAPIDSPVTGGSLEDRPMAAWIFGSEAYTQRYHQLYAEFLSSYFDSGEFAQTIDSVTAMITPYVEKDPTKFCTLEEFTAGAAALRAFCLRRAESVRGQLEGTIPSTSQGQQEDGSALVDASDINIQDMGGMDAGGGFGGGPGGMGGGFERDQGQRPARPDQTNALQPDAGQQPERISDSGGQPPGPENTGTDRAGILLLASGAVLLLGLAAASRFQRR